MSKKLVPVDRRSSPRRPTQVQVVVTHPRFGLMESRLRDIGLEGAFVEIGNTHLHRGTDVELLIRLRPEDTREDCRVLATVARTDENGTAFVFRNLDEAVFRALFDVVYVNE